MNNKDIIVVDITRPRDEISFFLTCVSSEGSNQEVFFDRFEYECALKEAQAGLLKGDYICIRTSESTLHEELMILSEEDHCDI